MASFPPPPKVVDRRALRRLWVVLDREEVVLVSRAAKLHGNTRRAWMRRALVDAARHALKTAPRRENARSRQDTR